MMSNMFEACIILVALGAAFMLGRLVEEDNHRKLDDDYVVDDDDLDGDGQ